MCNDNGTKAKEGGMKTDRAEIENGSRTAMKEEEKLAAKGSKPQKEKQREKLPFGRVVSVRLLIKERSSRV